MIQAIDFSLVTSEIVMLSAICIIMIVDLFQRDKERVLTFSLSQLTLVVLFFINLNQMDVARTVSFSGHWIIDPLAVTLKLAILAISFVALFYARPYISHRNLMRGEYYLLSLFSILGMMVMVSAGSFLVVYLGLELLSLSLYALIALQRDSKLASESAVKYFVMGGLASGFLLYGISLIYGATGSLLTQDVANSFQQSSMGLVGQFGLVFIVIGLAFKFGAVPFHMWLPDIYHGAPTSITAFIASVPKVAAFGMTMRLLHETFSSGLESWSSMLMILALLSVIAGNLIAVVQSNLKRLLAYSGIAHIGYFLLGVLVGSEASYSAAMFYIIVYAVMTLAGFGIVIFMSHEDNEYQKVTDLRGMGKYHPWYALLFSIVMISMAGIPPFIGFWPKLEIFTHLIVHGYVLEAIIAIAFSVVGLYYYLKVIKEMYFAEVADEPQITKSRGLKIAISINCLLLLLMGLMPDGLYQYCLAAFGVAL